MSPQEFLSILSRHDIRFCTGVPDSSLKDFLVFLNVKEKEFVHAGAANEGQAIGIAAGYHIATGRLPLVYLQNAGLGNIVNPLVSLADKSVYGVPMLLVIGWRGEPGTEDEPQHEKMGNITLELLELLGVPYKIAEANAIACEEQVKLLKQQSLKEERPVALIFRRGIFTEGESASLPAGFTREEALNILLDKIGDGLVVSTTGKTSRELFELRERRGEGYSQDFLVVGSMGLASSIALGLALSQKSAVYILDGDGAALMHLGTLPTIGYFKPRNLCHILLDNNAHESTGGQPTVSSAVDWKTLFLSCGYQDAQEVNSKEELLGINLAELKRPCALIVRITLGSRKDLARPSLQSPQERKKEFMKAVSSKQSL